MKTSKSNLFFILLTIAGFFVLAIVIAYVIFSPPLPVYNPNRDNDGEPPPSDTPPGPGSQEDKRQIANLKIDINAKNNQIASLNQNLERKDILIAEAKIKQGTTEMVLADAVKSSQNAEDETQANAIKMIKLMEEKTVLIADRDKLMQEKASLVAKLGMFTPENVKKMQEQIGTLKNDKKNLEESIQIQRVDDAAKMIEISSLNQKNSLLKVQLANINIPQLLNIDTVNLPNNVKLEMVLIPSGKFTMGSPISEVGREFETQHEVTITKPYYMGKYEVTQEQWKAVMGTNPSFTKGGKLPVTDVSWHDSQEFIKKLNKETGYGFRLPSEAEWEYACRAGTKTAYSFGDRITKDDAKYGGSTISAPAAIESYKPNAFGLYHMHGNVWEWCEDWKADYPAGAVTDPQGPAMGNGRVLRGGCFLSPNSSFLRSAYRLDSIPTNTYTINGLRLVKTK